MNILQIIKRFVSSKLKGFTMADCLNCGSFAADGICDRCRSEGVVWPPPKCLPPPLHPNPLDLQYWTLEGEPQFEADLFLMDTVAWVKKYNPFKKDKP